MAMLKEYRLSEIATISTGFPFKGNQYSDEGVRVVRGENVTIGSLRWDTIKCWNHEFNQFEKYSLNEGDIVIGMDGSRVGKNRAQIRKSDLPLLLAQRVACIRANKGFSQDLIAFLIKSQKFEQYVSLVQTGTTIPHISQTQIEDFRVTLPESLKTQNSIASILSSLDDKIELNNQINQHLETLAQALFKQWFVDFEFPDKNGDPYKSSGGEMVESDLGEIPKGWIVKTLSDVIEIKHGYAFKGEFFSDIETSDILVTPGNFKIGGGFNYNKFKYYSGKCPEDYILKFGDLIVTMTDLSKEGDTLGYSALVPSINERRLLHNQRVGKILYKGSDVIKFYLYWLMRTDLYRSFVLSGASGTTVKHTSPSRIGEFKTTIPDDGLLKSFDQSLSGLYKLEINNNLESDNLSSLRDSLLPKLVSCEVEISGALTEVVL